MYLLTPIALIAIHEMLIAEFGGMRGITEAGFGRLDSAAAAPYASMFGVDVYPDIPSKAAALCNAIVRAHPFSDGNKRVALAALDLVLTQHGYCLTATNQAAYTAIMDLAQGTMGREALIDWVKQHTAHKP